MKTPPTILFLRTASWTAGRFVDGSLHFSESPNEESLAESLNASVRSIGVWLALPSRDCLATNISIENLPRRGRDLAVRYRLEERIPWAAEEMNASFIAKSDNGGALAVAVRRTTLDEQIDSLQAHGVHVLGASPAMMLAASRLLRRTSCDAILIHDQTVEEGGWVSLIHVIDGTPAGWHLLALDAEEILDRLQSLLPRDNRRIVGCDLPVEIRAAIANSRDFVFVDAERSADALACEEAIRLADGDELALIDLYPRHRESLSTKFMMWLGIAVLAASCLGLLCRASRYAGLRAQYEARSRAAFVELFPGSTVPAGVVSRLVGEARLLRTKSGDGPAVPQATSLSPELAKVLSALDAVMPSVHFSVSDVRIDENQLSISGEAAKLDDADALAEAIRGAGDWTVAPPRTEQLASGLSFTLTGASSAGAQSNLAQGNAQ